MRSTKGTKRIENRDYVGLLINKKYTICIIVDVSTQSIPGTEFARYFINSVIGSIQQLETITPESVTQILKEFQQGLRSNYLHISASYLCFFWCSETNLAWSLILGDCRLGLLQSNSIDWVTPVHTGANPYGDTFTDKMKGLPERHIVTRSLHARGSTSPELVALLINPQKTVIIASDGYWAEISLRKQFNILSGQKIDTEDDCTYIEITKNLYDSVEKISTINNFLIVKN